MQLPDNVGFRLLLVTVQVRICEVAFVVLPMQKDSGGKWQIEFAKEVREKRTKKSFGAVFSSNVFQTAVPVVWRLKHFLLQSRFS